MIGIAGLPKKIDYLEYDLGLDKGIDYKQTDDMAAAIKAACPNGVDIFFDNVGGELFDAVFANINEHARLAICGQITDYNAENHPQDLRPMHMLIKKVHVGKALWLMISSMNSLMPKKIGEWYNDGKITYTEHLIEGFNNIPAAFIGLFLGENIGK